MPVYEPYPGSQTALRLSPYKDTDSWLCRSSLKEGKKSKLESKKKKDLDGWLEKKNR